MEVDLTTKNKALELEIADTKAKLKSRLTPDSSAGLAEKSVKLTNIEILKAPGYTPSRDLLKSLSVN
jgi:hypothetical protein